MRTDIFYKISEKYNVTVKEAELKEDIPLLLSKNKNIFYVNKRYSLESQVYSVFHTLAHRQLGTLCSESNAEEEKAAEILTYELLIPEDEIRGFINYTLFKLKDIFPYCSFETIAKRLLYLRRIVLTIWYSYTLVFREKTTEDFSIKNPDPFEIECMKYSFKNQSSIGRANENRKLKCFSYFIKEESKKKVILLTERINI